MPTSENPRSRSAAGLVALLASVLAVLLVSGCGSSSASAPASGQAGGSASASAGSGDDSEADPGSCPTSNTKSFAKTKFVAHAGLAFGAFHRYIYKPARAGGFSKGANGRVKALLKAGAAALFIKREVRLAAGDAQANPTLCRAIADPLRKFADTVSGLGSSLRNGDLSAVTSAEGALSAVKSASGQNGTPIQENENAPVG